MVNIKLWIHLKETHIHGEHQTVNTPERNTHPWWNWKSNCEYTPGEHQSVNTPERNHGKHQHISAHIFLHDLFVQGKTNYNKQNIQQKLVAKSENVCKAVSFHFYSMTKEIWMHAQKNSEQTKKGKSCSPKQWLQYHFLNQCDIQGGKGGLQKPVGQSL